MTFGKIILLLIVLYYIIESAVCNGIQRAYTQITGKETPEMENVETEEPI